MWCVCYCGGVGEVGVRCDKCFFWMRIVFWGCVVDLLCVVFMWVSMLEYGGAPGGLRRGACCRRSVIFWVEIR